MDGQLGAQGLALSNGELFWATRGIPEWPTIQAINAHGGTARTLAVGPGWPSIVGADAESVYWVEPQLGRVLAVRRDGGSPRTLWRGTGTPNGLAVDATQVYWTDQGNGTISSVPKRGGRPRLLARGQPSPLGILVVGDYVIWANMGSGVSEYLDGSIMRVRLDGTGLETLARRQLQPSVLAMAGERLIWVNVGRNAIPPALMSLALDRWPNAAPEEIARIGPAQAISLAADSTHVYWTIQGSGPAGQVEGLDLSGRHPYVIASGQETPWGIAVDADAVYWTTQGSVPGSLGKLMRIDKPDTRRTDTMAAPPTR
jgi:sugar lactone lactonase YvrE